MEKEHFFSCLIQRVIPRVQDPDSVHLDSMLPSVCSVIDHRRLQNKVRTSVTHSTIASCATIPLFLSHFAGYSQAGNPEGTRLGFSSSRFHAAERLFSNIDHRRLQNVIRAKTRWHTRR